MIWNAMNLNPKKTKRAFNTGVFRQRGIVLPFQNQPGFHRSWYTFLRIFHNGVLSPLNNGLNTGFFGTIFKAGH